MRIPPITRTGLIVGLVAVLVVVGFIAVMKVASDNSYNAGRSAAGDPPATQVLEPGENPQVNASAQSQTWLGHADKVDPMKVNWKSFRNGEGYLIPRDILTKWANGQTLLFEGEQQKPGVHDILIVMFPNNQFTTFVGDNGLRIRNQGSFWVYQSETATSQPEGYVSADDLLMVFARDKRNNWINGKPSTRGNPITVWLSTGPKTFQPSDEITLSQTQGAVAKTNDTQRCPSGSQPLVENTLGKPNNGNGMLSSVGSFTCTTILIRGNSAVWFVGSMENVPYSDPDTTLIILVPHGWGVSDMTKWVKDTYKLDLVQTEWSGQQ